jgi:hypothetical protein
MTDSNYEGLHYCVPCKKKMVKAATPEPPPPPVQMCEYEGCSFRAKPHYGDFNGKHYCLICKPKAEKAAAPAAEEAAPPRQCEVLKKDKSLCGFKGNKEYRGVMCCTMHLRNEGIKFENGVTAAIKKISELSLTVEGLDQVGTLSSHSSSLISSHVIPSCLQEIQKRAAQSSSEAGPSAAYEELELEENEEEDQ